MGQRRAYTNLGILLSGLKRPEEAAACYCKAIALRPKHPEARKLLALAHCTLGEVDDATRVLKEWLEEEPGNPIVRHMLAACTGKDVPERVSNAFVEAPLTVLRRASKRSSRGCRIARQRSWQPCWRIAAFNRRIASMCWMQVVELGSGCTRRAFCAPGRPPKRSEIDRLVEGFRQQDPSKSSDIERTSFGSIAHWRAASRYALMIRPR